MVWILRVKNTAAVHRDLALHLAPLDVGVVQDVSEHRTQEEFVAEVKAHRPDLSPAKIDSRAQCLMSLVVRVQPGDLVIVHGAGHPFSCVAVSGASNTEDGYPALQFKDPIPLNDIPEDIKNSMKAHIALSRSAAPQAEKRLSEMRTLGVDTTAGRLSETERLGSLLSAQDLAFLVSDILETDGYQCRVSPPGPDGGVDIYAGKGLLGLGDSLLVQVKSGKQVVSAPVVYQILGNMVDCGAKATLIVSWSGFTAEARSVINKNPFKTVGWSYLDILKGIQMLPFNVINKWQERLEISNKALTQ